MAIVSGEGSKNNFFIAAESRNLKVVKKKLNISVVITKILNFCFENTVQLKLTHLKYKTQIIELRP
jgi:hypothetical protein